MAEQTNKVNNKETHGGAGGKGKNGSKGPAVMNLNRQYDQLNQGLVQFVSTLESKRTGREIYQTLQWVVDRMNGEELTRQQAAVADRVIEEMERFIRDHPDGWTTNFEQGRSTTIIRGWKQLVPTKIKERWGNE